MIYSFGPLGHTSGFGGFGVKKFNILKLVMCPIKLKGMSSLQGYIENFYPRIKLVTLGWGQRIKYHLFLRECWDLRWLAVECVLVSV